MDPTVLYLRKDILPKDKSEADKVRRKMPHFWLSEDQKLYKRFFSGPYLLCIHPEASELLLEELHEGFVEATQEVGLCLTKLSLRTTSGQICRKKHKSM